MQHTIHFFNCFTTPEPHSGNPAAVLLNFSGHHEAKQKLATALNLPVMIFMPVLLIP